MKIDKNRVWIDGLGIDKKDLPLINDISFVLDNEDMLSSELPQDYLDRWSNSFDLNDSFPGEVVIMVQTIKQAKKAEKYTINQKHNTEELGELIHAFGECLKLIKFERNNDFGISLKPFKIFDFEKLATTAIEYHIPEESMEELIRLKNEIGGSLDDLNG